MTEIILAIVAGLLISGLGFYVFVIIYASHKIFFSILVRETKDTWSRNPVLAYPQDEMDAAGQAWMKEHIQFKKDVHIIREGANLYGEFYDLGYDRAVMILSGRTETLRYGYYFGIPYAKNGFNVLVVDPRGHGLSDGKYNTLGFEESKDALQWAKLLHDEFGMKSVLFHGLCIGAASGMLAITSDNCPDYIRGIITEGMFPRFRESMRNNLRVRKKLMWPLLDAINFWFHKHTGHTMNIGPDDFIDKLHKPLLMLQSEEDPFSTAKNARLLYEKCPSEKKQLVMFETGGHSVLRHTHTERYDQAITDFLSQHFPVN